MTVACVVIESTQLSSLLNGAASILMWDDVADDNEVHIHLLFSVCAS